MIKIYKTQKLRQTPDGGWPGELAHFSEFFRDGEDLTWVDKMSEEGNLRAAKVAFYWMNNQFLVLETLEHHLQMTQVLLPVPAGDKNIINIHKD